MATTKDIKAKIKSVGNIKKITKTMEMVAASKMRKATERALQSQEYALAALEILVYLKDARQIEHPLLTERTEGKTLLVIMASNKGLCGAYNINISREVAKYKKSHPDEEIECITIGKQGEKIAKRHGFPIVASFVEFKDFANTEDANTLYHTITNAFLTDTAYKKVEIAYTQFVKALNYQPKLKPLLPIHSDSIYMMIKHKLQDDEEYKRELESHALYLFEPSEEEVLDHVIPELLTAVIFQVLLDAYASEHSSRMVAMKNASDNAGEMQDSLRLSYNKARQATITREISEISAGAEALQ